MTTRAFQKVYTKIDNITKATVTLHASGVGNDELATVGGKLAQVVKIDGRQRDVAGLRRHRGAGHRLRSGLPRRAAQAQSVGQPGRPLLQRLRRAARRRRADRGRGARDRRPDGEPLPAQAAFGADRHGHRRHRPQQYDRHGTEDSLLRRSRPALQRRDGQRGAACQGRQDHPGRHGPHERRLPLLQAGLRERRRARPHRLVRQHDREPARGAVARARHGADGRRVFRRGQGAEGTGAAHRHDALRRCAGDRLEPHGPDSLEGLDARLALFGSGEDLREGRTAAQRRFDHHHRRGRPSRAATSRTPSPTTRVISPRASSSCATTPTRAGSSSTRSVRCRASNSSSSARRPARIIRR